MLDRIHIEKAYEAACQAEIDALKPGNVHRFASGHRMTVEDFYESARVTARVIADPSLSTGQRIFEAVSATRQAVGTNTNLGIILLCVPLACAAEMETANLRKAVAQVLAALDMDDTRAIYQAILLASPGGLGSADEHDVREEPRAGIVEVMAAAANRDMIARQYASGFLDIFETGLPAMKAARDAGQVDMWPTIHTYLSFLAAFEDSHILRKHGQAAAEHVRGEAAALLGRFADDADVEQRLEMLLSFDRTLKAKGFNPGTSADMTVATCFAFEMLRPHKGTMQAD